MIDFKTIMLNNSFLGLKNYPILVKILEISEHD